MDYRNLLLLTTMGLAIICESLREAVQTSNGVHTKRSKQALAYIQGTGLEITIQSFALDLNADSIRQEFYKVFHADS